MHIDRLFQVLVVHGALLGAGCDDPVRADTADATGDRDETLDTATPDTGAPDLPDEGECADAVCEATDEWSECLADGVQCCWATGVCCDVCCGHLEP